MISRSKRIILIAAVVLVVAVASFAWVTRRNTEKRLTALRGAGMPVTAVDLDSWYKHVPADENQALVVLEAWKLAHTDPAIEPREKLPGPGEPVPEEQNSAISDYLSMNQAALQKLFSLNGSGPSRYPIDLSFGPETLLPHLARVKSLALLLNFSVLDRCEADDSQGALRSVLTGFTLARTLRDEPILISELVRAACITITLSGAERLLTRFELTDDELLLLDGALRMAESDGRRALPRVLAGERAGGIGIFSLPYSQIEKYGVIPTDLGGGVSDIFKGLFSEPTMQRASAKWIGQFISIQSRIF